MTQSTINPADTVESLTPSGVIVKPDVLVGDLTVG